MGRTRSITPTRRRSEGNFLAGMGVGVLLGLATAALAALLRPDGVRKYSDQEHADRSDFRAIGRVIAPWGRRIGDLRFETEGAWKRAGTTVEEPITNWAVDALDGATRDALMKASAEAEKRALELLNKHSITMLPVVSAPGTGSSGRSSSPVKAMSTSSYGTSPESRIMSSARSRTLTGSPMSRMNISPPVPSAPACSTSCDASGMVMK